MNKLVVAIVISLCAAATASAQDRLDAARMLLFDRDWPKAVAELRRIAADKHEPQRDEASFWLAHSLFQMGKPAEGLRVIADLEAAHPRSRWLVPAQALRVEIASRTDRADLLWSVAMPAVHVMPRIRAPKPPTPSVDLRIQALGGLLQREPDRAVPVLREIVAQDQEAPQARRALFVISLSDHDVARRTVMHFARTGPESLRVVAVGQLARFPSIIVRKTLTDAYRTGSARVKFAALRSLRTAGGDDELITIARQETDDDLRGYAVSQLRQLDTTQARAYLKTLQ